MAGWPLILKHAGDGGLQAGMGVGNDELHAVEAARLQPAQKLGPEGLRLGGAGSKPDDLPPPVGVDRDGDYGGDGDDPPALTNLQVGGIQPDIGPFTGQRTVQELADALVNVLAEFGHRALGDAAEPHGLNQFVHAPGRDAADPRLLDHRDQRLLRRAAGFEEAREVPALPQLRHAQVQRSEARIEAAIAIAVAVGCSTFGAFVAACTDDAFDIGLHDQLENRLGDGAEEIAIVMLGEKLGERHGGFGHRGFLRWRVEVGKLHPDRTPRWPPRLHRTDARNFHHSRGRDRSSKR